MPPDLQFDAETHTYRLAGRVVPSVTQALQCITVFDGIPPDVLETARVRGQYVHEACDLYDRGILEVGELDLDLVPYVDGYINWLTDSGAVVIASELRVANSTMRYAGTIDRLAIIEGPLALVDIKATAVVPPTVGPQTAAYAAAYTEQHGQKIARRYSLHLHPKHARGYKFTRLTDSADWSVFVSALNVTNFIRRYHNGKH